MAIIKTLPDKDFYAVIFSSTKQDELEGYTEMDDLTLKLAHQQPGFMGFESVSNENKTIFISYWETRKSIEQWSRNAEHIRAKINSTKWYKRYLSQICKVENSRYYEK